MTAPTLDQLRQRLADFIDAYTGNVSGTYTSATWVADTPEQAADHILDMLDPRGAAWARAQQAAPHRLSITIDGQGGDFADVSAAITCTAPEGATCRRHCADEGCQDGWPDEGHEHRWIDTEECLAEVWINEQGVLLSYDGSPADLRPGPVEIHWDSDRSDWLWGYPS